MLYAETGLDMEKPEQTTLDFATVPHVAGVPRYMFRSAAQALLASLKARMNRDPIVSFDRELWLWFFAGVVRQRWRDRQQSVVRRAPRGSEHRVSSSLGDETSVSAR
jgi:hypothetical protein